MKIILKLHEDFLVSHLRAQATKLQGLVNDIENRDCVEDEFLSDILKQVEFNLRQLRKTISRY